MVKTEVSVNVEFSGSTKVLPQKINATLTLLNSADQPIASIQPMVADSGQDKFTLHGEVSARDAVALVVDIRHDGFTSFARRVPIESTLYMQAKLEALSETAVSQSNAQSVSGAVTNGFTLQIKEGTQQKPSMSISIPASSLPAGTQSINAAIKTYDPNNAKDAQYFPGSYADSTGNGLVSVAFNFAQVTTNSGESLQALAENARIARQATSAIGYAAPAEPVIINRTIPTSSCATLKKLGDANAELAGFQIPVYTYNARAGLWDLLGYGTVYQQDGTAISADASSLDCTNGVYVLEIKVTNEIFLSEWWNLDYPLQFTAPKKRCANLQIVNEDQEPLAGVYGLIEGAGDFASSYFVSDAKGQAKVNVDIFAGDTTSAHYVVWDAIGGQGSITLSDTCPATSTQIIVIKRPQLCKIKGKIEYLNKPFGNIAIWAIASSETFLYQYYYVFGATNSEGIYNLDVACGVPYQPIVITAQDRELPMIAVDNQASADELSDDGSTSWVKPITFTELPFPTIFYSANYVANTQEGQLTFIGLHDAFPITYNLQVKNLVTGVEFASAMGSLEGNPDLADDIYGLALLRLGQLRVPLALPQDTSNISLIGTYTDGFGITTEVNQPLLILPTGNGNAQ